jgi:two-component system alkaline phosphatase synthesis response regulator PhoP
VSSKQKDNLLDGTRATVHTDTTQRMSIQSKAASDEKIKKETKRILIVDDEDSIVKLVKMYLEHHRYEVIIASDGQEGLEKAKTEKPDLIVLDLMLPKMNGYKVCGLLKKDTRYAKTPVILFTAKAQEKDVKLGEEVGADAYITKPYEPEILLAKIKELLKE